MFPCSSCACFVFVVGFGVLSVSVLGTSFLAGSGAGGLLGALEVLGLTGCSSLRDPPRRVHAEDKLKVLIKSEGRRSGTLRVGLRSFPRGQNRSASLPPTPKSRAHGTPTGSRRNLIHWPQSPAHRASQG